MRCRICNSPCRAERTVWDDRHAYPGRFDLMGCSECGHHSLAASMSETQIADLYTNYYPRSTFDVEKWTPHAPASGLSGWWRGLRSAAYLWVPRNVKILDIGCGFGESLGYHRDRGCDVHGVEADLNILRVAERHKLSVRTGLFQAKFYEAETFDFVTLDQVVEHVANPVEFLAGVAEVLRPGGTAIISTPNAQGFGARLFGDKWIHWHAPYHLGFFTSRSMSIAAANCGLTLESTATITHSAWLHFQWCHLACYPEAGEKSAFWNGNTKRTWRQTAVLRTLSVIDRIGLNALLTRLGDWSGIGDNIVFVLRKPLRS